MLPVNSVCVRRVEQAEHDCVHNEPALSLECRVVFRMLSLHVVVDEVAEGLAGDGNFYVDDADFVRSTIAREGTREEGAKG